MEKGYIAQECITFCLRYFEGVETIFNRPERNDNAHPNEDWYLFATTGQSKGQLQLVELDKLSRKQAYRYVVLHLNDIDEYHRSASLINKQYINLI